MTNLSLHMNMDSFLNASTASLGVSIREFLPIPQTTQKSESYYNGHYVFLNLLIRVLLATIRDKGHCPCPRCLVLKTEIPKIGQKVDRRNRLSRGRTYLRDVIKTARHFIYNLGRNVKGAAVERLLEAQSWVPTFVSEHINFSIPRHSHSK